MTESNSVELLNVEFFLIEKLTLKVEIPLFWGFVHPSDFPKSGGDPVYGFASISDCLFVPFISNIPVMDHHVLNKSAFTNHLKHNFLSRDPFSEEEVGPQ